MIPNSLIGDVLDYYHKGFGMHVSEFKIMALIKENLFWHSIHKDVKAYTKACVHCGKFKPNLGGGNVFESALALSLFLLPPGE